MIVEFDKSFEKSLGKIGDRKLLLTLKKFITVCESAKRIDALPNIKKLTGFANYHRLRIGAYRIGFELIEDHILRFIIVANRKEIYKLFPKR